MDNGKSINNTFIGKVVENKFYFSERNFNGLFCFDLLTKECEFIDYFIGESKAAMLIHKVCVFYKGKLFFMPERSRFIHIYDIRTGIQSCIDLGNETGYCIYDYVVDNNFLYYFQIKPVSVVQIDMENNTMKTDDNFPKWYNSMFGNTEYSLSGRLAYLNGKVYIPTSNANLIIEWDIRNNEGNVYETDISNLVNICIGKDGFWITDIDTYNVYLWNPNSETFVYDCGELIEDKNIPSYFDKIVYNHVIELEKHIIIVLRWLGYILIRDNENTTFRAVKMPSDNNLKQDELYNVYGMFGYDIDDKYLYIFSSKGLITLEKKTLEVTLTPIVFKNPAQVEMIKIGALEELLSQNDESVFIDEYVTPLDIYCKVIGGIDSNKKEKKTTLVGKTIMEKIKNEL